MDCFIISYCIAFFCCFCYMVHWMIRKRFKSTLHKCICLTLIQKTVYLFFFLMEALNFSNFSIPVHVFYNFYKTFLFSSFILISAGCEVYRIQQKLIVFIIILLINIASVLHVFNEVTFGSFLVITEGLLFLYIVKKSLELLETIYNVFRFTERLDEMTKKFIFFLVLIYVYFVNEMVKLCLTSIFNRFDMDFDSVL